MLQSKAGIDNLEYKTQWSLLAKVDTEDIPLQGFLGYAAELWKQELGDSE